MKLDAALFKRTYRTSDAASDRHRSMCDLELAVKRGQAELAQRLRLDLPDALARQLEALADLLERLVARRVDAEAHAKHLLLARREELEQLARLAR